VQTLKERVELLERLMLPNQGDGDQGADNQDIFLCEEMQFSEEEEVEEDTNEAADVEVSQHSCESFGWLVQVMLVGQVLWIF
jgi:hypothetical protein